MRTLEEVAKAMAEVEDYACKHCGRCVLAGPPCCYDRVYELWQESAKEVQWLRKIQGRLDKRINELLKKIP